MCTKMLLTFHIKYGNIRAWDNHNKNKCRKAERECIIMMYIYRQAHTSANTSVNSTKLPTAFTTVKPYGAVCDYGSGKYTDHIRRHCMNEGATSYQPYDPYNQSFGQNMETASIGVIQGYDTLYLCNVLNVIDSDNDIWYILYQCYHWVKPYGRLVIQIYEGNKSGKGRETKHDCYQRNQKTADYVGYFGALQGAPCTYEIKGNIIIVKKGA